MGIWEDIRTAYRKDPALHGFHAVEVVVYGGLWAVWMYRVAHRLWNAHVPLLPRVISELARIVTGIEIHPGAHLGRRIFIDHGSGIVIGETAVVGDDCVLYHGVTLGARGWWVDGKGSKRHPTIGNDVTLAVGCTVLGPVTVGDQSRIGPGAVVIDDVPPGCVVVAAPSKCVKLRGDRAGSLAGVSAALSGNDSLDGTAETNEPTEGIPAWLTTYEMGGL